MRMITHSYDSYDEAVRIVNALEATGIPHDDISLVSGDRDRMVETTVEGDTTGTGTGATIGTVLGGGAGLLAGIGALAIPGVGPVVAAGWLIATLTGAGVGAAAGGLVGSLANSGVDEADAQHYAEHVGRGGTLVTVRATDEGAANAEYILEHGEIGPMAGSGAMGTGMGAMAGADDRLQVVGEREVEPGGMKVTPNMVETPVAADRRPVNRPLTGTAADEFRERPLQDHSTPEWPVVGKEARVVEEIGLRKEASDRTQAARDTVRETKVGVEQVPGTMTGSGNLTGENPKV